MATTRWPSPYPFGGQKNTYNNITTGDNTVIGQEFASDPRPSGIKLFRQVGTQVVALTVQTYTGTDVGIECSSCHDPHNGPTVKPDPVTERSRFVRGTVWGDGAGVGTETYANGGIDDYLCVKCHTKNKIP